MYDFLGTNRVSVMRRSLAMLSMNFSKINHIHNTLRLSEEEEEEREKVGDGVHPRTAAEAHPTEIEMIMMVMMMTLVMMTLKMVTLMMIRTKIKDPTYPD